MESFLPTEIARLVYGYLIEEKCESAAKLFLETSSHLKECLMVTEKGRTFNTQVSGHSLLDILDKLCDVTYLVRIHTEKEITGKGDIEDFVNQLRNLLIPKTEKKVRLKRDEPIKNTGGLLENPEIESNLYGGAEPALQENNDNILDSLCHLACTSETNNESAQEKCSIKPASQENQSGDTSVCQQTKSQQSNDLNTSENAAESSSSELTSKEKCNNTVDNAVKNDCLLNTNQRTDLKSYHTDLQTINFGIENLFSNNTTKLIGNNEQTDISNKPKTIEVNNLNTNSVSNSTYNIRTLQVDQNGLMTASTSLPLAIKTLSTPYQTPVKTINLNLNNSPKIHISLLNQHQTSPQIDYLKNVQQPLTAACNLMQPFVRGPATIYIKSPVNSPFNNIFSVTNEHRPSDKPIEKPLLIKPSTCASNDVSNDGASCLKDGKELSSELDQNKTDKIFNEAPVIKRSGVRTRGGYRKGIGKYQRRVKAHLPNRSNAEQQQDKVDLTVRHEESGVELPQITSNSADMCVLESEKSDNLSTDKKNTLVDNGNPIKNIATSSESLKTTTDRISKIVENVDCEKVEPTTTRVLRKRISLSVPRRGSHVRALDFKTPSKNSMNTRRAITSPKQIHASRSVLLKKSLRNVRGALFKSPSQKKENTNKSWDADLRLFTAESADIPTSVGLQRKNTKPADKTSGRRKCTTSTPKKTVNVERPADKKKSTRASLKDEESNDDLADKIQKEVLSVIDEEDINLIGENPNLVSESEVVNISEEQTSPHSANKLDQTVRSENNTEPNISTNNSIQKGEKVSDPVNSQPSANIKQTFGSEDRQNIMDMSNPSSLMTPVSKVIYEHRKILENGLLTPGTPLSPRTVGINTPPRDSNVPKIQSPEIALASPNISLISQDSIETSLIKECERIENENRKRMEKFKKNEGFRRNSESIFDTPEKSDKNVCNETRSDPIRSTAKTLLISNTNENMKNCLKSPNATEKTDAQLYVSDSDMNRLPANKEKQNSNHFLHCSPDVNNSVVPIRSVNNENNNSKNKENEVGEGMSFSSQSDERFPTNKSECNSDLLKQKMKNKVDDLEKNRNIEMNNANDSSARDRKSCSPHKVTFKNKTESMKIKNRKNSKEEIDCSKLIAQCLESAKNVLYGSKNNLLTEHTANSSVVESRSKHSKINSSPEKNKKSSNVSLTKHRMISHSKIKNINELLFSDSSSSTSEDSDTSINEQLNVGNNHNDDSDDHSATKFNLHDLNTKSLLNKQLLNEKKSECPKSRRSTSKKKKKVSHAKKKSITKPMTSPVGNNRVHEENTVLRDRQSNDYLSAVTKRSTNIINSNDKILSSPTVGYGNDRHIATVKKSKSQTLTEVSQQIYSHTIAERKETSRKDDTNIINSNDKILSSPPIRYENDRHVTAVKKSNTQTLADVSEQINSHTMAERKETSRKDDTNIINSNDEILSSPPIRYERHVTTVKKSNTEILTEVSEQINSHTVAERNETSRKDDADYLINKLQENYKSSPSHSQKKSNHELEKNHETVRNDQKQSSVKSFNHPEVLDNYVYNFTIEGENDTKQLKISPTYTIFEMESVGETPSYIENKKSDKNKQFDLEEKSRKSQQHHKHSSGIEERNKKRKLSGDLDVVEALCDEIKMNSNKKSRRDTDSKDIIYHRSERHQRHRYDQPRKEWIPRMEDRNYSGRGDRYSGRHRNSYSSSRYRRYQGPPRRWNSSRRIELSPAPVESPKRIFYRAKEDIISAECSHRYQKEREEGKKHEDKKNHDIGSHGHFKSDSGNSRCATSKHSVKPASQRMKKRISPDKEDGELSESSLSAFSLLPALVNAANETKRMAEKCGTLAVDENTRAKLKKLNLDHFLSLLHGTEK